MINIIRHKTLSDCLRSFGVSPQDHGWWEWTDSDGTHHRQNTKDAMRDIRHRTCWGWCENKELIHVWVGKKATVGDVIGLLAHEMGHVYRPHKKNIFNEEQKAAQYAEVALTAYNAAQDLVGRIKAQNSMGGGRK